MKLTRKYLIDQAEEFYKRGKYELALLKYKQSIEKGICQNGRITQPMVRGIIEEIKQKINGNV